MQEKNIRRRRRRSKNQGQGLINAMFVVAFQLL